MQDELRYYIMIKGPSGGPHAVSEIRGMLDAGEVNLSTRICEEHSDVWTTVGSLSGMPVPPLVVDQKDAGSGSGAGTGAEPPVLPPGIYQPLPPRMHEPESGIAKRVRLGTLAAAVLFFFLPWLEFRCAGFSVAYQSGWHTIVADADLTAEARENAKKNAKDSRTEMEKLRKEFAGESPANAWLVAAAAALVISALIAGICARARLSGVMALTATALISIQMITGFPAEDRIEQRIKKMLDRGPAGKMTRQEAMSNPVVARFMPEIRYTPWLWSELGALVACIVLSLTASRGKPPKGT